METLTKVANTHGRTMYASPTSFSDNGTDFGSPEIKLVPKNRIAILKGDGVSSLSYGAVWHYFETQLKYPLTSIDTDNFSGNSLQNFDILIMPGGFYGRVLNENRSKELKDWIRGGGKVIAMDRALSSFAGKDGFSLKRNKTDKGDEKNEEKGNLVPYDQRERESVKNFITGSIYKVQIDPSHPMAFGYDDTYFSLKLGSSSYQFLENGYNVGYIKGDAESVAGFSGEDAKAKLKNSLVFGESRMGRGSVIYMVDNVLFRSFWENGKLFLANSLFFVNSNVVRL